MATCLVSVASVASAEPVILHQVPSAALGGERTIRVWKPEAPVEGVIYLHDGQNLFDPETAAFGQAWEVDEAMTRLIGDGSVPPMLVVGIDHGGQHRIDELTMSPDRRFKGGQGNAYATFVMDEVMPFITATYGIEHDPASTYIGGSSLGGLMTLELLRQHPDVFAGGIVMSPSVWWNDDEIVKQLEEDASALAGKRVWLDIGSREGQPGPNREHLIGLVRRLAEALERQDVDVQLVVAEGGQHHEAAWRARFPDAMKFVLRSR